MKRVLPPLFMKINKDDPIIILEVLVSGSNGSCRVEMALDTGATFTMIPWDVAERLGYDPAGSAERVVIMTASSVEKAPLIVMERVKIFDREVENIKAVVHDLPSKSRVDGLLGLSFLKHFDIDLHFKKGCLKFRDG